MTSKIPDRWLNYSSCGTIIAGTNIICFKVPLELGTKSFGKEERWNLKDVVKKVKCLKAIIDLTNTNRYYNPLDLKKMGIAHKKILVPGRILPPETSVKTFMDTVDKFSSIYKGGVIGVHCTHGLNRTGYMVCRYMRDRLGFSAQEAIKRFQTARGYHIERQNYIADLLGKRPPPPDLGVETTIKPLSWRTRNENNEDFSRQRNFKNFENRKRHAGAILSRGIRSSRDNYDYSYDY